MLKQHWKRFFGVEWKCCDRLLLSIRAAKWQSTLCKSRLLAGQTRNARVANVFAALILIGCRDVKQLRTWGSLKIPFQCQCWRELVLSVKLKSWRFYCKMEDQLLSTQNSDLNNGRLNEIEQKAQAKNTKEATERGVKKFDKWCLKGKISVDLKTISPTDLNEILRNN